MEGLLAVVPFAALPSLTLLFRLRNCLRISIRSHHPTKPTLLVRAQRRILNTSPFLDKFLRLKDRHVGTYPNTFLDVFLLRIFWFPSRTPIPLDLFALAMCSYF